jgi:diacylglycerol kinase (ATP)|tara:strand:+ start:50 stop:439 length:390 start_codon:yes stop_codon:yes gene_type:complete
MSKKTNPPKKIHGVAHVFAAAAYSWAGIKRLWGETAFRHETLAACIIIFIFILIQANISFVILAILLILITFSVEALNTAIEEIADMVSPEWSLPAKHAKDLGSLAVFCMLCANGIFAAFVILTTFNWI